MIPCADYAPTAAELSAVNDTLAGVYRPQYVVTISREPPARAWDEIQPYVARHWAEVAPASQADIPVLPDYSAYAQFDEAGQVRCVTARVDGRLVGYLVALVMEHPHHPGSIQADVMAVYVEPHERGRAGALLLRQTDDMLRHEGVEVIRHRVKQTRDWSPVLLRMGYEAEEITYSRRLR